MSFCINSGDAWDNNDSRDHKVCDWCYLLCVLGVLGGFVCKCATACGYVSLRLKVAMARSFLTTRLLALTQRTRTAHTPSGAGVAACVL